MADVKESALTQQSDCKWVRALDANGNSIRISKEDLASVVGGRIGNATTDKDGLMSRNDKKSMPQRLALSPLKITGLESGRGFFCEIVAQNYECGLYYIYRTNSNVYYYLITGALAISSIKIKDDAIYIIRDGVVFNITCLHGNDIKLDYSAVVPDDAIQGIKK